MWDCKFWSRCWWIYFLGVADKKADADRITIIDGVNPIEINGRYVVGLDREAKFLGKPIEEHVQILINALRNSELTNPLKTQVLMKIDTILYKGLSVIRITVPAQNDVSFVGEKAFTREDSSTVEAKGPKLLAVSKRFQR